MSHNFTALKKFFCHHILNCHAYIFEKVGRYEVSQTLQLESFYFLGLNFGTFYFFGFEFRVILFFWVVEICSRTSIPVEEMLVCPPPREQGTVLGPVLSNCSLDDNCAEGQGYVMGTVEIKALEFVDDKQI